MNRTLFTTLTVAILAATGCSTQGGESDLAGSIEIDGSSTVFPISEAVAEEFGTEAPAVNVKVGQSGTGGGFEKFCNGETQISDASRPIEEDEAATCSSKRISYVELKIAIDGLSVVVNRDNDFVECLTISQLKAIWEPGSTIGTWRDVNDAWPDDEIELYGPGADSGTFDYFTDVIVGEEGASRNDYTASEDDNVLVQGMGGDRGALGYFGYAYYVGNEDKVRAVAVDGGGGCVEPTEQTIADGTYAPLSRPLFIYVSKEALGQPEVAAFARFYLETVDSLLGDVGYIPLHRNDLDASREALSDAIEPSG